MKVRLIFVTVFLTLILLFTECRRTLIGTTHKLSGTNWVSDVLLYRERTIDINNHYEISFSNFERYEGIFKLNQDNTNYYGAVRLEENNTRLVFFEINKIPENDSIVNTVMNSWKILKLTRSKFWIETNLENNDVEIRFLNN